MRYYWMEVFGSKLHKAGEEKAFENTFIVEAPSKKAFWEVVKKVKGNCVESTPLSKIKMGVKREFLFGDPVKFKGTPVEVVERYVFDYLKIMVTKDIYIYIWINDGDCTCLQPI